MSDWEPTEQEVEDAVYNWVNERSERIISMNRGHWEQLVPIIGMLYARKLLEWGESDCPGHDDIAGIATTALPYVAGHDRFHCLFCILQLRQEVMGDEG